MRIEIENVGFDDNDDDIDVGVDVGNVEKLPKKPPFVGVRSTKEVTEDEFEGSDKEDRKNGVISRGRDADDKFSVAIGTEEFGC